MRLLPEPLGQRGIIALVDIGELAAGAASDSSGLCANFCRLRSIDNRLDRASPWNGRRDSLGQKIGAAAQLFSVQLSVWRNWAWASAIKSLAEPAGRALSQALVE